jgi:hypothetical protein
VQPAVSDAAASRILTRSGGAQGVVGAMILTMVFPLVLAPENEIAQSTRDFFGDDVASAFRVLYQVGRHGALLLLAVGAIDARCRVACSRCVL